MSYANLPKGHPHILILLGEIPMSRHKIPKISTRWCPSSLAKLVPLTPITMVYGRYIYIYYGL